MNETPLLVLGVDPGIASLGLAGIAVTGMHRELVFLETLRQGTDISTFQRQEVAGARVTELIRAHGVGLVCIEDQAGVFYAKALQGATNFTSRQVQGVVDRILGIAATLGVPALVIRPQTVRALMGASGTKGAVAIAAARQCPGTWKGSSHAKDAAAIAIAGERKWSADRRVSGARRVGGGQK